MNNTDHLRVRNSVTAGFIAVLALGICGYANTVNTQREAARHNRQITALVTDSLSSAKDLALYSSQMSANTGEYVHTGDVSYREFAWEASEKDNSALAKLEWSIKQLPDSDTERIKFWAVYEQDRYAARPIEEATIKLASQGKVDAARSSFDVGVVPTSYRIEGLTDALISSLQNYQKRSELLADRNSTAAIAEGWLLQAIMLAISVLIAVCITVITGRNVRSLIEIQGRLADTDRRLGATLQGAPLILFATDRNGVFTLLEGEIIRGTGMNPDGLIGHKLEDLFPNKDEAIENINRAIGGQRFTATVHFDDRTYSVCYNPQRDKLGKVTGLIGVATDITERSAAEYEAERLVCELEEANHELAHAYDTTIQGWSAALDLRDRETDGHSRRVCETTVLMAQAIGMTDEQIVQVRRGALLHDIGKMGIPDSILLKPGPLTDDEWVIMRKHPQYAYDLLSGIDFLQPALEIPLYHHEKWDGTGYPHKIAGENIPLSARIFAIVDVWDALSSDRPYRAAWPQEKVLSHIRSLSGTHFDPRIVEIFERVIVEQSQQRSLADAAATAVDAPLRLAA